MLGDTRSLPRACPFTLRVRASPRCLAQALSRCALPPLPAQIFVSMVVLSMALAFGFWHKVKEFKAHHYYVSAMHTHSVAMETFFIFWGYLILLSVLVPMAMFVM